MQSRSTQALYAYWNEIRGDRVAPRRLEIEPARIGGILHETFVLERPGPHDYRFRLAGTAICEAFGCELRGTSFLDGWDQDDSGEIDRALSQSLRLGAAVLLELEASPADASCAPSFEALLLPLYHVQPEANRLIGTLARTVWRDALLLHYEIPKWDGDLATPSHYVPLSKATARRKVDLLHRSFPSQRARDWWDDELFLGLLRLRGVEARAPYAEGFFVAKAVVDLG